MIISREIGALGAFDTVTCYDAQKSKRVYGASTEVIYIFMLITYPDS